MTAAQRLAALLVERDIKGVSKSDVLALVESRADASDLWDRAIASGKAYLAENGRIYSTAPWP